MMRFLVDLYWLTLLVINLLVVLLRCMDVMMFSCNFWLLRFGADDFDCFTFADASDDIGV